MTNKQNIRLTQFSPGAGCGCKISPALLTEIIGNGTADVHTGLLVGNDKRDDAAVFDLGDGNAVISTTDFFMPIVDDAFDFGRIAAANAISDIYAMGGKPLMAISILGWPIEKLDVKLAAIVLEGAREICREAGIPLAGGHSIDSLEPIFGLAVTGNVAVKNIKRNSTAEDGCHIYLTKPIGTGILSTAQKKGLLNPEHFNIARDWMAQLNNIGATLGGLKTVKAMTDVTGFGLLGHLLEICRGSGLCAEIVYSDVPIMPESLEYLAKGCIPGGTKRNFKSYGHEVNECTEEQINLLCDPQTSGGLLIALSPWGEEEFLHLTHAAGIYPEMIGSFSNLEEGKPIVTVK